MFTYNKILRGFYLYNIGFSPLCGLIHQQWGTVSQSVSQETEISFPINFKSNCYFIIGNDILDTTGNILTLFAFRNINTSVFIRNAVVFGKGGGITFGQVKFCYYLTMGK